MFTSPMARQFVGFDTLFDELNKLSDHKEQITPHTILPRMMTSIIAEVALAGFSADDISLQTEKGADHQAQKLMMAATISIRGLPHAPFPKCSVSLNI